MDQSIILKRKMGHIVPKGRWERIASRVSSRTAWSTKAESEGAGGDFRRHRQMDDYTPVVSPSGVRTKIRDLLVSKNMTEWIWVTPERIDGMDVMTSSRLLARPLKSWKIFRKALKKIVTIIVQRNL